jgi:hypothetical protein
MRQVNNRVIQQPISAVHPFSTFTGQPVNRAANQPDN